MPPESHAGAHPAPKRFAVMVATFVPSILIICLASLANEIPPNAISAPKRSSWGTWRLGPVDAFRDYDYRVWGEYNSRVYQFALRFPRDLFCITEDPPIFTEDRLARESYGTGQFADSMKLFSVTFGDFAVPVFEVTVYEYPRSLSLLEFGLNDILSIGLYEEAEIQTELLQVDECEAVKLRFRNKPGGYDGIVTPVYVRSDDRIYRFSLFRDYTVAGKALSYDELSQLILQTVRIYYSGN